MKNFKFLFLVTAFVLSFMATLSAVSAGTDYYICHATGKDGKFVQNRPANSGVLMGHFGDSHQDGRDIIPPVVIDGVSYSQNWDEVGAAIHANGCETPDPTPTPTEPVTPTPTEPPVTPTPTEIPVTPTPTEVPVTPTPTEVPATPTPTEVPATPTPTEPTPTEPVTPEPTEEPATPVATPTTPPITDLPGTGSGQGTNDLPLYVIMGVVTVLAGVGALRLRRE